MWGQWEVAKKRFFELKDKIEFPTNAEIPLMRTEEKEEIAFYQGYHSFRASISK